MINIENSDVFGQVIADCLKAVDENRQINTGEKVRCVNAIGKAAARLQDPQFNCFMEFDGETGELLIWNTTTNCVYTVTAAPLCQCMAHQSGVICWHKAARRLYELYLPLALKAAFERNEIVQANRKAFCLDTVDVFETEVTIREVAA